MVLIFSDIRDNSTTLVLDWLIHLKQPFKVLFSHEPITIRGARCQPELEFFFTVPSNDEVISTKQFTAVWYRRNIPSIILPPIRTDQLREKALVNRIETHRRAEQGIMAKEFSELLSRIPSIGSPLHCDERSLRDLSAYAEVGGCVPRTIITSSKATLKEFYSKCNNSIVCKKLNYGFQVELDNGYYAQYTEKMEYEYLQSLPDEFGLTLFQEYIPKHVELRIYVLKEKFFTMAIFSQANPRTRTDFRQYDDKIPTRTAPYTLPESINKCIHAFMKKIGTNTGSIDMVLTPNNEYIFLEINTIGQFGMVSQSCNFQFEKDIAYELRKIANPAIALA